MLDIDHFKSFNDNYGHQVGDEALRVVGAALAGGIRSYDCAGRYGGEEFICFLPETCRPTPSWSRSGSGSVSARHGCHRRQRRRRREVGMTVSIGIATWPECPAERIDDLVASPTEPSTRQNRGAQPQVSPPRCSNPATRCRGTPLLTPLAAGDTIYKRKGHKPWHRHRPRS